MRWGHILVLLRPHVIHLADVPLTLWQDLNTEAWRMARALRACLAPSRVWVASLGAQREDLPMTSPHLHVHVIPLGDEDPRPREVLTWQNGVVDAEPGEWQHLVRALRSELENAS